ncbi:hypothetical protein SAMN05444483_103329 [Salegentibacter echinorum]|uniref:Lipoprotein n=1 Tax=Salegentibacter echinorum TaxID=1073325 RepID=A0A1M5FSQ3_SALEC|nr:hypothetical protein [Salegentibacter echinorum]SHF94444.1 hypothetical protein SAMN05444483_103329 [Salegentibacter echinorum]
MKQLLFLLCVLTFASCDTEDDTVLNDKTLTTAIEFYAKEVYKDNKKGRPHLNLILKTEKPFPCANFTINFTQNFKNGKLTIHISGINKSDICLTAIGPATGYLELPEKTQQLNIVRGDQIDKYRVNINSKKIEIVSQEQEFTKLVNPITLRYPENSFAVICGTNLEQTYLCEDFLTKLKEIEALTPYNFPKNGRIPYPDSSSGNWINTASTYYLYENEDALNKTVDYLKTFTQENLSKSEGNSLSIITWDNQRIYSYELLE